MRRPAVEVLPVEAWDVCEVEVEWECDVEREVYEVVDAVGDADRGERYAVDEVEPDPDGAARSSEGRRCGRRVDTGETDAGRDELTSSSSTSRAIAARSSAHAGSASRACSRGGITLRRTGTAIVADAARGGSGSASDSIAAVVGDMDD
jgi:hypothetical protein